jgi:hypothetical protein
MRTELMTGVLALIYAVGVVFVFLWECFKNRKLPPESKETSGAVILTSTCWPAMLAVYVAVTPFMLAGALYDKIAGKE